MVGQWGQLGHTFLASSRQDRVSPDTQVLFKLLACVMLVRVYWPKQVVWLSPIPHYDRNLFLTYLRPHFTCQFKTFSSSCWNAFWRFGAVFRLLGNSNMIVWSCFLWARNWNMGMWLSGISQPWPGYILSHNIYTMQWAIWWDHKNTDGRAGQKILSQVSWVWIPVGPLTGFGHIKIPLPVATSWISAV